MTDTIESFVAKLQSEGVEAGRKEAEKIRRQAEAQAQQTLQKARAEAEAITARADQQAQAILQKARTELGLAARDALLGLRVAIERTVQAVLAKGLGPPLSDDGFLRQVLGELIGRYAQADLEGRPTMEICVSRETQLKLLDWTLGEIARGAAAGRRLPVELKGALSHAGFEYSVSGGTVEVTPESVAAVLGELIGPELRKLLEEAGKEPGGQG